MNMCLIFDDLLINAKHGDWFVLAHIWAQLNESERGIIWGKLADRINKPENFRYDEGYTHLERCLTDLCSNTK